MPPLAKLLKPHALATFLRTAQEALGTSAYLAVSDGAKLVASAGTLPDGLTPALDTVGDGTTRDLCVDGAAVGKLVLGRIGRNGTSPEADAVHADLLALSLGRLAEKEVERRHLGTETLEQYREMALTQRAVQDLNQSMKLADVVRALLSEIRSTSIPASQGAVYIFSPEQESYSCVGSFGSVNKQACNRLSTSQIFRDVVRSGKAELVNTLDNDPRWGGEVAGLSGLMVVPLSSSGQPLGALALSCQDDVRFRAAHLKRAVVLGTVAATALSNSLHFEHIQHILSSLIRSMATAIDSRDHLTAGHSQRVASLALGLARAVHGERTRCPDLEFTDDELHEIFYAGLLHDVGKIGVREEVLTKASRLPRTHLELIGMRLALWGEITGEPDWQDEYARLEIINTAYDLSDEDVRVIDRMARIHLEVAGNPITILTEEERIRLLTPRGNLTAEEWAEIKRHPAESHRILKNIPFTHHYPNILTIVVQHHERMNGTGYPYGLSGNELLPQSRIMAIVDIYDSLRRDRHYKKALSESMALKILREEARQGMLDDRLVEVFCDNLDRIEHTMSIDSVIRLTAEPLQ